MPKCHYCGENVEGYLWDEQGRIKCITCDNWEIRASEIEKNPNLIKAKGLTYGDKVRVGDKFGVIRSVDKRHTLSGELENYLVEFLDGSSSWHYPEEVEKVEKLPKVKKIGNCLLFEDGYVISDFKDKYTPEDLPKLKKEAEECEKKGLTGYTYAVIKSCIKALTLFKLGWIKWD